MTKAPSPLLGFNNNVRHKGRVFHIQTEDSGIRYPHVITHLFADGGRILKSLKTSYAEHVSSADMADKVRALMKEQHKAMFIALRAGEFDGVIEQDDKPAAPAPAPEPPPPSDQVVTSRSGALAASPSVPPAPRPLPRRSSVPPPRPHAVRRSSAPPRPPSDRAPVRERSQPPPAEARRPVKVDIDVLERAAVEASSRSPIFHDGDDMPPPPAAVLSSTRPSGSYRSVAPPPDASKKATPPPGRYSASRPASIFATARPSESGTVFGEDMISNKSLDEVILGFLSEEFGTNSGKDGEEKK